MNLKVIKASLKSLIRSHFFNFIGENKIHKFNLLNYAN